MVLSFPPTFSVGDLRDRVLLERPLTRVELANASPGGAPVFAGGVPASPLDDSRYIKLPGGADGTCACAIQPLTGRSIDTSAQLDYGADREIRIRYRDDVRPGCRATVAGQVYEIVAAEDYGKPQSRIWLDLLVRSTALGAKRA